ncbi:MAG: HlyD family type I secretion periplasmic adaptor subunit [Pseudomonadota bacterium]
MTLAMPVEDTGPKPASEGYFVKLGLAVITFVFGGIFLWSVLAPIDSAIVAPGQIVVETNRKEIQHLEGGVVGAIQVKEGDKVTAGQVVARLEDTVQKANVALLDGQLTELYARRARLEAERDGVDAMAEPRGVEEILATNAFAGKIAGQLALFQARRQTRSTQVSLLNESVTQQKKRIQGFNAQIRSLREQKALIKEELDGVRTLLEQGFASKTQLRELEREEKRLNGESGSLRAGVAEADSLISEAQIEIERLAELGREEAITELRDVEVSIAEAEERRVTALDALRRTEIRSPQAGRVLNLAVFTVGGVIGPGQPLMEIVPGGDRLLVSARVAPQDVDKVRMGQETLVRFSTFGSRQTPEATGLVKTISADSIIDEMTGMSFYNVTVELPADDELAQILRGETLVPGMPVETFIRTGSKSAISYLLKPLTDSMARSLREE